MWKVKAAYGCGSRGTQQAGNDGILCWRRTKNTGVGQEWNRILRVLPQAFERGKQKSLVFLNREADGAAELLASQSVLNRRTHSVGVCRIEDLAGLQCLAERKRILGVHNIV